MPRIANHQIDAQVRELNEFVNYNGTISADRWNSDRGTIYGVVHWNTRILDFNIDTKTIEMFRVQTISQTTSTLVGRLLRNLPTQSVMDFLNSPDLSNAEKKRLHRMARL
jgi:hypothetical protein